MEGSAQPSCYATKVLSTALPLASLDEQHRIAKELDQLKFEVDALNATRARTGAELDALLPAILDRAFAGAL